MIPVAWSSARSLELTVAMTGQRYITATLPGDNSGIVPDEVLKHNVYKGNSTVSAGMTFKLPAGTYKFGLCVNTDYQVESFPRELLS